MFGVQNYADISLRQTFWMKAFAGLRLCYKCGEVMFKPWFRLGFRLPSLTPKVPPLRCVAGPMWAVACFDRGLESMTNFSNASCMRLANLCTIFSDC